MERGPDEAENPQDSPSFDRLRSAKGKSPRARAPFSSFPESAFDESNATEHTAGKDQAEDKTGEWSRLSSPARKPKEVFPPQQDATANPEAFAQAGSLGQTSALPGQGHPAASILPDRTPLPPPVFGETLAAPSGIVLARGHSVNLRAQVIELELLSARDWDKAAAALPLADTARLLGYLQQLNLLTSYQARLLAEGRARDLKIGDYRVTAQLGEGGMGTVYAARNVFLGRMEALKLIRPAHGSEPLSASRRREILKEAKILAQLDHPLIPKVYSAGFEQDLAYIAMEYITGEDAAKHLQRAREHGEKLAISWVVETIAQVADVLNYAHGKGVIHRDIKPANLMITADNKLKLLDMGIAKLARVNAGMTNSLSGEVVAAGLGTAQYMPPEQWRDADQATPASDVYSLGHTLYCLLKGEPVYRGPSIPQLCYQHCQEDAAPLSHCRPDVPPALDAIVAKMIARAVAARYQNAAEVARDLRAVLRLPSAGGTGQTGDFQTSRETPPPPPPVVRLWLMLLSLTLAGAILGGGIVFSEVRYGTLSQSSSLTWLRDLFRPSPAPWSEGDLEGSSKVEPAPAPVGKEDKAVPTAITSFLPTPPTPQPVKPPKPEPGPAPIDPREQAQRQLALVNQSVMRDPRTAHGMLDSLLQASPNPLSASDYRAALQLRAKLAAETKQWSRATQDYATLLQLPDLPAAERRTALLGQARAFDALGQTTAALASARAVFVDHLPSDREQTWLVELLLRAAEQATVQARPADAREYLRQAEAMTPDALPVLVATGKLQLTEEPAKAITTLRRALVQAPAAEQASLRPLLAQAQVRVGQQKLQAGQPREACQEFENALKLQTSVDAAARAGLLASAQALVDQARQEKKYGEALEWLGRVRQAGVHDTELERLEARVRADMPSSSPPPPTAPPSPPPVVDGRARFDKAEALLRSANGREAVLLQAAEAFGKLANTPGLAELLVKDSRLRAGMAWRMVAEARLQRNDFAGLHEAMTQAANADSPNRDDYFRLEFDWLKDRVTSDPLNWPLRLVIGKVALANRDFIRAIQDLKEARRLAKSKPETEATQKELAAAYAAQGTSKIPTDPRWLATVRVETLVEARQLLDEAVKLDPTHKPALADAYAALGARKATVNPHEAAEHYCKAAELDPARAQEFRAKAQALDEAADPMSGANIDFSAPGS